MQTSEDRAVCFKRWPMNKTIGVELPSMGWDRAGTAAWVAARPAVAPDLE
jgi:hypothetical protein